jgi:hypothetical protein
MKTEKRFVLLEFQNVIATNRTVLARGRNRSRLDKSKKR